jgi:anti-anti-sigma factor
MAKGLFETQRQGRTLILVPQSNLSEFDFESIEAEASDVLALIGDGVVEKVIVDFHKTDFYGSTALGFFVKIWKRVRGQGGRMAFCNVSEHEREVLRATKLDHLWPVCESRAEAEKAIGGAA